MSISNQYSSHLIEIHISEIDSAIEHSWEFINIVFICCFCVSPRKEYTNSLHYKCKCIEHAQNCKTH